MEELTLLLLIDAFRGDYRTRTPYIDRLASHSAVGALREGFGFVPRAAYFAGLSAQEYGFTNMFCYGPQRSPFGLARCLPAHPGGARAEHALGLRALLEQDARQQSAPFAAAYLSSLEMPLEAAPYFEPVEKYAPWDRRVGYRSLFHILDDLGYPWLQCSWPDSTRLPDPSDAGIVRHVLENVGPQHRFLYVHLQELDGLGHAYGPGSREVAAGLAATDRWVEQLVEGLRAQRERVHLILFGDHGMVPVTRQVDVWAALKQSGLKFGSDYVYFLDSSMARFWCFHRQARQRVAEVLSAVPGGRLLTPADQARYGLEGCDPRNGELIFLMDAGVMIFPNYFQATAGGPRLRGMHGYDPDCPDNQGIFILHAAGDESLAGRELGKVDPPAIFPTLLDLLGLPAQEWAAQDWAAQDWAARPSLRTAGQPAATRRFTLHPDPQAEASMAAHIQAIQERILQTVISPLEGQPTLVLTGSFGRGEGGVQRGPDGCYRAVNDFDWVVVDPHRSHAAELEALSQELVAATGTDYVDLADSRGDWDALPPTMFHYDLKYGSRVLAGDPSLLARIPAYVPADLPLQEGILLLLNRTAGILTGLRGGFLAGAPLSPDQQRYLTNQLVKATIALADRYLIEWESYSSSYSERRERFAWLAPGAGLAPQLIARVAQAYHHKLYPEEGLAWGSLEAAQAVGRDLFPTLQGAVRLWSRRRCPSLSSAMQAVLEGMSANPAWVQADNARLLRHPILGKDLHAPADFPHSFRFVLYSALPRLLEAGLTPALRAEALAEVTQQLAGCYRGVEAGPPSPEQWEKVRAEVVRWWFALSH